MTAFIACLTLLIAGMLASFAHSAKVGELKAQVEALKNNLERQRLDGIDKQIVLLQRKKDEASRVLELLIVLRDKELEIQDLKDQVIKASEDTLQRSEGELMLLRGLIEPS